MTLNELIYKLYLYLKIAIIIMQLLQIILLKKNYGKVEDFLSAKIILILKEKFGL